MMDKTVGDDGGNKHQTQPPKPRKTAPCNKVSPKRFRIEHAPNSNMSCRYNVAVLVLVGLIRDGQ